MRRDDHRVNGAVGPGGMAATTADGQRKIIGRGAPGARGQPDHARIQQWRLVEAEDRRYRWTVEHSGLDHAQRTARFLLLGGLKQQHDRPA